MNKIYKKTAAITLSLFAIAGVAFTSLSSAAGTATLAFSTSSTTAVKDTTISLTITANSGASAVNVVTADFTYDPAKLQFISIDASGSSFATEAEGSGGGGTVAITRAVAAGGTVTGSNKVASVNFRVLISTSTTGISFAGSSAIYSSGVDVWNASPSTLTLTLSAPAAPPAPTTPTSPTSPPSTTTPPTTPAAPAAPSDPAPAKPSATTPPPSSPVVTSGQNIPDDKPVPVTNAGSGATEGYIVTVQVFDKTGLGKPNIKVTLGDKTETTDSLGIASFSGVVAGEYTVKAEGLNKKVTVKDGSKNDAQNFTLNEQDKNSNLLIFILGGVGVAILIAAVMWIAHRKGRRPGSGLGITPEDMHKGLFEDSNSKTMSKSISEPSDEEALASLKPISNPAPSEVVVPTNIKVE